MTTKNVIGLIVGVLFFTFAAVFIGVTEGSYMFAGKCENVNTILTSSNIEDYKGKHVSIDIHGVIENYAETKHKTNGITTGTDQHYIIWLDDGSMISLRTKKKKNIEQLNNIMNDTWDYLDKKRDSGTDNPLYIEAEVSTMDSEIKGFYDEMLDYYGISDSNVVVHYVELDTTKTKGSLLGEFFAFVFFGLLCLAAVVLHFKKPRVKKAADDTFVPETYNPETYKPETTDEFGDSETFDSDDKIKLNGGSTDYDAFVSDSNDKIKLNGGSLDETR